MSIVDRFLWCFHWWIHLRGSQSGGLFGATVPWRSRCHAAMPWTGGAPQNGEVFGTPFFGQLGEFISRFINLFQRWFHGCLNGKSLYKCLFHGKSPSTNGWLGVKPHDLGHIHIELIFACPKNTKRDIIRINQSFSPTCNLYFTYVSGVCDLRLGYMNIFYQ